MAVGRSLRSALASLVPTWLTNVPGFRNLYSFCYTVALLADCMREMAWQGRVAAFPGLGTPTALPLAAQSRGLIQGPAEPDATFAARLNAFRETHKLDGSPQGLALAIQAYLVGVGSLGAGVYPVVRVVDRSGNAVTANADRSLTFGTVSWDWDEIAGWVDGQGYHPPSEIDGWWGDHWVIIQDPFTHYTSFSDANWLAAWGSNANTIDSICPQSIVQDLAGIVGAVKGEHMWIRSLVWTANPAAFSPPGNWGNASQNVATVQTLERSVANAYWDQAAGG